MKNLVQGALLFFVLLVTLPMCAQAEEVSSFLVVYDIAQDGSVSVTETITYDFGQSLRHGIFRTLETAHSQPATSWYKKRSVAITDVSVTKNGVIEPFTKTSSDGVVTLKIGRAESTISGVQVYTLSYRLLGALSYGDAGAEFYWNATGNDWGVPIVRATAVVNDTTGTLFASSSACYVGEVDATSTCERSGGGLEQSVFSAGLLMPLSGLTIAQELKKENIAYSINETSSLWLLWYVLPFVWLVGFGIYMYRYKTKYKVPGPVIAQYEPYEGVLPMYMGVLLNNKLDASDITAGIVYLAEQGVIKIKKTEEKVLWLFNTTDYEITLLTTDIEGLPAMLQNIISLLFIEGLEQLALTIRSESLAAAEKDVAKATSPKDTAAAQSFKALMQRRMAQFKTETLHVGDTVRISALAKRPQHRTLTITRLAKLVSDDLKRDGFIFDAAGSLAAAPGRYIGFGIMFLAAFAVAFNVAPMTTVVTTMATISLYSWAAFNRRTEKGYEALWHIKGFALFLSVTDAERFAFHNAPEKSSELFMKYLPYAIALKVEKEWSKVFAGVTIPQPVWYEGGTASAFTAGDFATDIGAFSSAFTAKTQTASGRSGISGSSGGGRVGGGGGGGGGGSW